MYSVIGLSLHNGNLLPELFSWAKKIQFSEVLDAHHLRFRKGFRLAPVAGSGSRIASDASVEVASLVGVHEGFLWGVCVFGGDISAQQPSDL